ncbi:MAG: carboxyl transferase domain-containing protein [Pseudomonadota bacterium]|nr:carboxyl transferase domain-containing protein [Pseudomonadota bacterium]
MKLLVANRGEIAIRIIRGAAELGLSTVAVAPADDFASLHVVKADESVELQGIGTAAYLDIDQVIAAATDTGCDAIHPGYGFLAENAELARRCTDAGLTFVGPSPEMLELFGDKARARKAAVDANVPVIRGIDHAVSLAEAEAFFKALGDGRDMMIKAAYGGGGRGSRMVECADDVAATYERCRSEAELAFGNGDVYVEEFIREARHVEVQILGDQAGNIVHLYERECSVQRRFQKIIEIAPAPALDAGLRDQILDASVRFAGQVGYTNAGTFEFLVDSSSSDQPFAFIEANARLQVEHTVSEEVTGVDVVQTQLRIAQGESLKDMGLTDDNLSPRGYAIQARVCMESVREDGSINPEAGVLTAYSAPSGPGVRTDGFGYAGYETSLMFDSLLAKVIGHSPSPNFADAISRTSRALAEFHIEGVDTNIGFLQTILQHPDFATGDVHTRFIDEHLMELANADAQPQFVPKVAAMAAAGARAEAAVGPEGAIGLVAPMQGTLVELNVAVGDEVRIGQPVAVVEAMKLQHDIKAESGGVVCEISMSQGDVVREGYPIVFIFESEIEGGAMESDGGIDLDALRGDMQEVFDHIASRLDDANAEATSRLHESGRRTPRENIDDLLDTDTFLEFGRPSAGTAEAGTVMGIGTVNAGMVGEERARVAVVHSNYLLSNYNHGHYAQEQVHELVHDFRVPLVLFSEGDGKPWGNVGNVGIDASIFSEFARLSALVPLVGINTGHCYAGNATLLGCCDTIIATKNSTLGMNSPDVVAASGLGDYNYEELGAMTHHSENGNVDIVVEDDVEAVHVAQQYLSYFQGAVADWEENDQRRMRHIIPENRVRTYDMRDIITTLADKDSVLEIRKDYGIGTITSLIRVEGKPLGIVANNPAHLAGAIDRDGADNASRFFHLCDSHDIPLVVLMDCPGIMVGPDHEREALVRHAVRLFNIGGNCTTPMFGVMVRKAYGLGVQAMIGGASYIPFFNVAWPTAEFAGMNIDGAVKLSARRELAAIEDADERKAAYDRRVSQGYEGARAINSGARYVIDPADTRAWLVRGLKSLPETPPRTEKKRPYVDTW